MQSQSRERAARPTDAARRVALPTHPNSMPRLVMPGADDRMTHVMRTIGDGLVAQYGAPS